jgi:hypothetical protein
MIWELPLAFVSFFFNRLVKNVMRAGLMIHDARNKRSGKAQDWIVLSLDDMLARPGALPLIMTTAPRWNTHAVLATLSPLRVYESIEIDTQAADRSADSWTIVVCTHPGRRTVTSIGSRSSPFADGKATVRLQPGIYWLGLRYYELQREAQLPAVDTDGRPVTSGRRISGETNSFYRDLHTRSNLFYLGLHYYVFVVLRHPVLFSEAFTRRELLPLGNPETEFLWGALRKGEELHGHLALQALADWNVFLTVYSQASFPIHSEQVRTPGLRFAAPMHCIYLFRLNRKAAGEMAFPKDWLRLQTR